jgi:hypothetical protein
MKSLKRIFTGCLLSCASLISAQTGTGTCFVVQQPCNGNGILAVSITSGLTLPLNYYYYNPYGTLLASHININSYNDTAFALSDAAGFVYVTDALGGTYYNNSTGMIPPFIVDPPVTTHAVCPSLTGTFQVTINGGTSPSSVQWYEEIPWTASPGIYAGSGNPISLPPAYYSALVTDASGCTVNTRSDSINMFYIDNVSGISFSVPTTNANCTNGTASVSGLTGGMAPYTYLWSNGANTPAINSLSQGSYTVTVTDAQGCNNSSSGVVYQTITIGANPVISPATCLQNDGSVISFGSGGTPPYTYNYSNGFSGQTATNLNGGTYMNVTATDANGCTGTDYIYIGTTTVITVTYSSTNSSCTAPTGSVSLNISGGTAPYTISWFSAPAFGGTTLTGLAPGAYSFSVTDAAGCVQSGAAIVLPASIITANAYSTNPVCPATIGSVNLNITGSDPPFTFLWNTGATTAGLSGVPVGTYSCVITDNIGCSVTRSGTIAATSPVNVTLATSQASCLYANDGSIYANVTGGTAPYTFNWNNGQTTQTATGLAAGGYYVSVQDANGCYGFSSHSSLGYDPLNTSCYCTITGKVFKDLNGNCIFDSGEQGIEHIMIHCSGFGYSFTDADGDYFFNVPSGTYTLSEVVEYAYPLASCQSNSIPVTVTAASSCVSTVDFANNVTTIHDIHVIRTSLNNAVPGNNYTQTLIVQNEGTVNESGIQVGSRNDGQLDFTGTSPVSFTQLAPIAEPDWYSINSGFPSLSPGASVAIYCNYFVPTYVPINTLVNFKDTASDIAPISNWLNDYTPWNNVKNYNVTVIGSYDPNFKEVSPAGTGVQGFITTADSSLDYIVHFQNTGSYYAQKVVVIDTLDADLDWESLRTGYSDHQYTASLSEDGVLTFTFDNIHLDWQSNNDLASRGLVTYSIKQNPNLPPGTEMRNSAAIYFDYNAPVITNQTLNTIQFPDGINEAVSEQDLTIYPNPANEELFVNLERIEDAISITICDIQGRVIRKVKTTKGTTRQRLETGGFVNGLYFVQVEKANGQTITKKFVKN